MQGERQRAQPEGLRRSRDHSGPAEEQLEGCSQHQEPHHHPGRSNQALQRLAGPAGHHQHRAADHRHPDHQPQAGLRGLCQPQLHGQAAVCGGCAARLRAHSSHRRRRGGCAELLHQVSFHLPDQMSVPGCQTLRLDFPQLAGGERLPQQLSAPTGPSHPMPTTSLQPTPGPGTGPKS